MKGSEAGLWCFHAVAINFPKIRILFPIQCKVFLFCLSGPLCVCGNKKVPEVQKFRMVCGLVAGMVSGFVTA